MEPKESKTNSHFYLSLLKSGLRFMACFAIFKGEVGFYAIWLAVAEVIGIFE